MANPASSTILGATKLTGRLGNGVSVGMLDAVTQRESAPGDRTIEPATNYFVGRAQRDFRQGASSIGTMVTSVGRNVDQWSKDFLRSSSYAGGLDFRHQFLDRNFEVSGYYAQSLVQGSASAIARTQRSSVHYYQRPDDDIAVRLAAHEPRRLLGADQHRQARRWLDAVQHGPSDFLARLRGQRRRFSLESEHEEPVLLGQYHQNTPRGIYRYWNFNINEWSNYTWDNTRTELGGNFNAHMQFKNSMWLHFGEGVNAAGTSYCDNCTRGGPVLRARTFSMGLGIRRRRSALAGCSIRQHELERWRSRPLAESEHWSGRQLPRVQPVHRKLSYNFGHSIDAASSTGTMVSSAPTRRITPSRGSISGRAR